jgi:hypothetical protein
MPCVPALQTNDDVREASAPRPASRRAGPIAFDVDAFEVEAQEAGMKAVQGEAAAG